MNPDQLERLAAIRHDLRQLSTDVRADRDAAAGDTKTALRKANNRLEHADAQLRFAEQDATK